MGLFYNAPIAPEPTQGTNIMWFRCSNVMSSYTSVKNTLNSDVWAKTWWVGISWNGEIMGFKVVFETVK